MVALAKRIFAALFLCTALAFAVSLGEHTGVMTDAHPGSPHGRTLLSEAHELQSWLVEIRRRLHTIPELLYELHETSAYVREQLTALHIPFEFPLAKTGIVATLGTGHPVIALRADMDALPITEVDETDFISQRAGRMHACGHDGHTSMLLGAARLLKAKEASLNGTVKLIFQPAEEGGAGAIKMMDEGVLDDVKQVYGLHVWPQLPTGSIASKAGTLFAGTGMWEVILRGVGGHAALPGPQSFVDPIVGASAIVTSLQTIVSREVSSSEEAVVSVTAVHGGEAFNVIPDQVVLRGTLRALSSSTFQRVERRMKEIINGTAAAYGLAVEFKFQSYDTNCIHRKGEYPAHFPGPCCFPTLHNDAKLWQQVRGSAETLVGPERVLDADVAMVGEDFASFLERVPGVFSLIGIRDEDKGTTFGLHHPRFKLDEAVLPLGAAFHVQTALDALAHYAEHPSK